MTNPDPPRSRCGIHGVERESCACPVPSMITPKCSECGYPTAAPMEVRGNIYCQEHGVQAEGVWGCWIVYHTDMGEHIDAIFPEEIDALRFSVKQGFSHVKRVVAGDVTDQ